MLEYATSKVKLRPACLCPSSPVDRYHLALAITPDPDGRLLSVRGGSTSPGRAPTHLTALIQPCRKCWGTNYRFTMPQFRAQHWVIRFDTLHLSWIWFKRCALLRFVEENWLMLYSFTCIAVYLSNISLIYGHEWSGMSPFSVMSASLKTT